MKKEKSNNTLLKLSEKVVFFATHNIHKFNEARAILSEFNITISMLRIKTSELQSDSLKEIAQNSAIEIYKKYGLPILVEDSGLFIESLNGFPGPYAAYVYKTIGNGGLITLMEKIINRNAVFKSSIVFCYNKNRKPELFEGEVMGTIALKQFIDQPFLGFGFDPIFQPKGNSKLFAEMSIPEKNLVSHRAIALRKFANWYSQRKQI